MILIGNCTRDPELRTAGSTSVCDLGIAVNERYKQDGEWTERANFFNITVWGVQGENCAKYLEKGRQVAVQGRLRWEQWDDKDGNKRSAIKIIADRVMFLSGGGNGERRDRGDFEPVSDRSAPAPSAPPPGDDDIPFLWRPVEWDDRYEHGSRWTPSIM